MKTAMEYVKEFQEACDQPTRKVPELPPNSLHKKLRIDLLEEEFLEYISAETKNDIIGVADALCDMIYIICGTALTYGIPLEKCFDEVQRSNMTKVINGKVLKREDGKILKPETYQPPDLEKILKEHGWKKE